MRAIAENRGITIYDAVAEALPFNEEQFDFALMVTTICFLDDVEKTFKEAHRVIKLHGSLIVAFIDKNSPLGKLYEQKKQSSVFYKGATFYTVNEVVDFLRKARFNGFTFSQTVFPDLNNSQDIQPVKEGHGEGSFVVIRGMK
jgi:ubiquinone/menaquinone biosynthesis C-methylase UbiE